MDECLFCKIADGSIPSQKVYEDEKVVAFLDINPATPGHTLVAPKKHFSSIFDADEETLAAMISAAKKIAERLRDKLDAEGVNVIQNNGQIAGQIVNHIHIHVVPRYKDDKVIISFPRTKTEEKDLVEVHKKLSEETSKEDDIDW